MKYIIIFLVIIFQLCEQGFCLSYITCDSSTLAKIYQCLDEAPNGIHQLEISFKYLQTDQISLVNYKTIQQHMEHITIIDHVIYDFKNKSRSDLKDICDLFNWEFETLNLYLDGNAIKDISILRNCNSIPTVTATHLSFSNNLIPTVDPLRDFFSEWTQLITLDIQFDYNKLKSIEPLSHIVDNSPDLLIVKFKFSHNLFDENALQPFSTMLKQNLKVYRIEIDFYYDSNTVFDLEPLYIMLDYNKYQKVTDYTQYIPGAASIGHRNLYQVRHKSKTDTWYYLNLQTGEQQECPNQICQDCFAVTKECEFCHDKDRFEPYCSDFCDSSDGEKLLECAKIAMEHDYETLTIDATNLTQGKYTQNLKEMCAILYKTTKLTSLIMNYTNLNLQNADDLKQCFQQNTGLQELQLFFDQNSITNIDFIETGFKNLVNLTSLDIQFAQNSITNINSMQNGFKSLVNLQSLSLIFDGNSIKTLDPIGTSLKKLLVLSTLTLQFAEIFDQNDNIDSLYVLLDNQKYNQLSKFTQSVLVRTINDLTQFYRSDGYNEYLNVYNGRKENCPNYRCVSCYDSQLECQACSDSNLEPPYCFSKGQATEKCDTQKQFKDLIECINKNGVEKLTKLVVSTNNLYEDEMYKIDIPNLARALLNLTDLQELEINMENLDKHTTFNLPELSNIYENLTKLTKISLTFQNNSLDSSQFLQGIEKLQNLQEFELDLTNNEMSNLKYIEGLSSIKNVSKIVLNLKNNKSDKGLAKNIQDMLDSQKYQKVVSYSQQLDSYSVENMDLTQLRKNGQRDYLDIYSGEIKGCSNFNCYSCFEQLTQCSSCLIDSSEPPYCLPEGVATETCENNTFQELLDCISRNGVNKLPKLTINTDNFNPQEISNINFDFLFETLRNLTELEELNILMVRISLEELPQFEQVYYKLNQLTGISMDFANNLLSDSSQILNGISLIEGLEEFGLDLSSNNVENIDQIKELQDIKNLKKIDLKLLDSQNDFSESIQEMLDEQKYETVTSYSQMLDTATVNNLDLTELRNDDNRGYLNVKEGKVENCYNTMCVSCYEQSKECTQCLDPQLNPPECSKEGLSTTIIIIIVCSCLLFVGILVFLGVLYYRKKNQAKKQVDGDYISMQEEIKINEEQIKREKQEKEERKRQEKLEQEEKKKQEKLRKKMEKKKKEEKEAQNVQYGFGQYSNQSEEVMKFKNQVQQLQAQLDEVKGQQQQQEKND